jgi:ABC-type nickel/cobalt efflux system permease component RcnA
MRKSHRITLVCILLSVALVKAPAAWAHPLGNFSVNQYAGLVIRPGEIEIDFVVDMAEIPAFQEIMKIDLDGDGMVDPNENNAYSEKQCKTLGSSLSLSAAGVPVSLALERETLGFPPGQGGLTTMRLECKFLGLYENKGAAARIVFENRAYPERLGWREIVVSGEGVVLTGDWPQESESDRLRTYPDDMLSSPLDQRLIELEALPGGPGAIPAPETDELPVSASGLDRNDPFTRILLIEQLSIASLLVALVIAFAWGGLHALTPGHGKTIVGAYLVGSRGTPIHAVYLGITTTITHTAGVLILGGITLLASQYLLSEKLFPWLNLLSGLLVIGIGLSLFLNRLRSARRAHDETHHHEHAGVHELLPDGEHFHDHVHTHDGGHTHHTHLPPGADGPRAAWRSLLALGVSGGLLPCPSALVVMLGAIALDRIGFGLVLVASFSLGLASVLTIIGLAFLYAGRLFERLPVQKKVFRFVPVVSALFITLVGLGIAVRALSTL